MMRTLSSSLRDLRVAASTSSSFCVSLVQALVQALRWGDGHFHRGVILDRGAEILASGPELASSPVRSFF